MSNERVEKTLVRGDTIWAVKELKIEEGVRVVSGDKSLSFDSDTVDAITIPQWDDLRVPITAAVLGGTNDPLYEKFMDNGSGSTGVFAYAFGNVVEQEMFFDVQLPHGYKLGSQINAHVHWSPETGGSGRVEWGLEYTWQNVGAVFGNTTIITGGSTISSQQDEHLVSDIGRITPPAGVAVGNMLKCRIFRDVSVGSNYAAKAYLHELDFHYQIVAFGTIEEFPG